MKYVLLILCFFISCDTQHHSIVVEKRIVSIERIDGIYYEYSILVEFVANNDTFIEHHAIDSLLFENIMLYDSWN